MPTTGFRSDEGGAVAVVAAVMFVAVALASAVAITSADGYAIKTKAQQAIDAAVLAGASVPTSFSNSEIIAIAERVYAENRNKRVGEAAQFDVLMGAVSTFTVTPTLVTGAISFDLNSPFLSFIGRSLLKIGVEGAARRALGEPTCVLGLDPTEFATIDMNGQAIADIRNCAAMANSSNGEGIHQAGQPSMKAKDIGVNGGFAGSSYEPLPTKGVDPIPDPLASLPQPTPGVCHPKSGAKLQQETLTLTPGTYCGGLWVKSSSAITLQPGIYIMQDGPLTIDSQASVTGHEVMLAFIGPDATLYIIGGGSLNVTSPTSGTYTNIQFFGDRTVHPGHGNGGNPNTPGDSGNNLWFTVIGDSSLTYDGVLYTPSFHVWWAGGSLIQGSSPNYLAIAKKLWFQDHTQARLTKENRRNLTVDEPVVMGRTATLFR